MKYSLAIYCPPLPDGNANRAYRFATEVLKQGHSIYRLFFFNEGVLNCANSENSLCKQWQAIIRSNKIDAIVCIASAEKHGLSAEDSETNNNIHPIFTIGGVAQLVDASVHADRVITFAD